MLLQSLGVDTVKWEKRSPPSRSSDLASLASEESVAWLI